MPRARPVEIHPSATRRPIAKICVGVVFAAAILGPFLWCFGSALRTDRGFAFRDAAHFYYSLFEWTNRQWAAGRIPLWNPQENCGLPVLADGTSSVFYPGKLIFVLPFGYAWNYKLYTTLHMLGAAAAAWALARRWRASVWASGLAAVAYAFGGSVLFQYCNVVYLVGAAWLPLGLAAADQMLTARSLRGALLLGASLAMMVLGGDPQMAYQTGLLAAGYAWILRRDERAATCGGSPSGRSSGGLRVRGRLPVSVAPSSNRPPLGSVLRHRVVLLSVAALGAFGLSAVQVLPSLQWSRQSTRAAYHSPRSLYEIPGYLSRDRAASDRGLILDGLCGTPEPGTHHEHIYDFSVGPWRLAELAWPNCFGQMFPVHRRWASGIPAEGRVWTPSLYLGLIPLLLALSVWRVRRGSAAVQWMSWVSLLATLAAFGGFGLGWLWHEVRYDAFGIAADGAIPGRPVGGLYWLMVVLLPGYVYFRYPAKLTVIAALGLSQLAAAALDQIGERPPVRLRRVALLLGLISLAAWLASWTLGTVWSEWTAHVRPDPIYGTFDAAGSLVGLRASLLHTALLALLFWGLTGERDARTSRWLAPLLLLTTAADLAMCNGWLVLTAPRSDWTQASPIAASIARRETLDGDAQPFRVFRGSRRNWHPSDWATSSSAQRHRESFRWDRQTIYPKYHLENGLAVAESFGSSSSYDYLAVLGAARRNGWRRPDGVPEPATAVLNMLGVRYAILPGDAQYPAAEPLRLPEGAAAVPNASLWRSRDAYPRAWIVHQVVTVPPLRRVSPRQIIRRTRRVFFPDGAPADLRSTAVIEADAKPPLGQDRARDVSDRSAQTQAGAGLRAIDTCRIVVSEPGRVEIEARLSRAGLLVLSDLFYPGWRAHYSSADGRSRPAIIYRTNRIMRGVTLPAGEHRVVFVYRPTVFYAGAALSLATWIAFGLVLIHTRRREPPPFDFVRSNRPDGVCPGSSAGQRSGPDRPRARWNGHHDPSRIRPASTANADARRRPTVASPSFTGRGIVS